MIHEKYIESALFEAIGISGSQALTACKIAAIEAKIEEANDFISFIEYAKRNCGPLEELTIESTLERKQAELIELKTKLETIKEENNL